VTHPPAEGPANRWTQRTDVPRGANYDARFERIAAAGGDVHGEADLVSSLAPGPRILDAGCGTGRVAIELAGRGFDVVGVDVDPSMLDSARRKAPSLTWVLGDLATDVIEGTFDAVVLAGNVLIFVAPGTEATVVQQCAARLRPGGLMIAGFQLRPGRYDPSQLDVGAAAADLELIHRWSTWDRGDFANGDYQVSVHRRR